MNNYIQKFPNSRLRRLRKSSSIRSLVEESKISISDLIYPIFITYKDSRTAIDSMPGMNRITVDETLDLAQELYSVGLRAIALFPEVPFEKKDILGKEALNPENLICQSIRKIKKAVKELVIISDVALDPYTPSGHDGIFDGKEVDNDETIKILCKQALVNTEAGADIIAPSDMMDGRIGIIRKHLDSNNYKNTLIMSYAAKYASEYYSPFRDAVSAETSLGIDKKKSYQMSFANINEALREAALDIEEGADILMVKPGMPYLDVLSRIKNTFNFPTFSFQVSGEYSMLMSSINKNFFQKEPIILETLTCFKRAGADAIFTYFAKEAAKIINNGEYN